VHKIAPSLHWWEPFNGPCSTLTQLTRNRNSWVHLYFQTGNVLNFGDKFAPLAFEAASGIKPRWEGLAKADYVGLGSVLGAKSQRNSEATVWGSGFRETPITKIESRQRVLAVRGAISASFMSESEIVLGDPGLLVTQFVSKIARLRGKHLYIPHFSVLNTRKGRYFVSLARTAGYEVILPSTDPISVAKQILSAQIVCTSSLHALVFGYALGTPTFLVRDESQEPLFKFEDFLTLFDRTGANANPISLPPNPSHFETGSIESVMDLVRIRKEQALAIAEDLATVLRKDLEMRGYEPR